MKTGPLNKTLFRKKDKSPLSPKHNISYLKQSKRLIIERHAH